MKKIFVLIVILLGVLFFINLNINKIPDIKDEAPGKSKAVTLGTIPDDADIIFWSTRNIPQAHILAPSNLYVMNAKSGEVTQITFQPQAYEHAVVSPDRKFIAANRKTGDRTSVLWLLDILEQTEFPLAPGLLHSGNGGVDWSPDNWIYFAGSKEKKNIGRSNVYKVRADGSGLTRITNNKDMDVFDVSASEDGSMVAHVGLIRHTSAAGETCLKPQIWALNVDGTNHRMIDDGGDVCGTIGQFPLGDYDPEISPDNQWVTFSRGNNDVPINFPDTLKTAHDIWIAPLDRASEPRRLSEPGPISIIPDWHDGKILYTEYDERGNYVGLVSINPDGTGKQPLERHENLLDGGRHGKFINTDL